jgi:hypothetical protein
LSGVRLKLETYRLLRQQRCAGRRPQNFTKENNMTLALVFFAHPIGVIALLGLLAIGMATVGPVTPLGTWGQQAANSLLAGPFVPLSASGAVNPHMPNRYIITKATAAALTLAAPTAGADDGVALQFISTTAAAHTVTTPAAGNIQDGNTSGHNTVMTFNADKGAGFTCVAYNGIWYVTDEVGCSLTS